MIMILITIKSVANVAIRGAEMIRHLVRVHGDVPGATLAVVIVVGIVHTGEASCARRQVPRTPTARVCP